MRAFFFTVLTFLVGVSTVWGSPGLILNGAPSSIEIISKNEAFYISIRDVAKLSDTTFFHKRKDDSYVLYDASSQEVASFSKQGQSATYKQQPFTPSHPILFEQGRVYVPVSFLDKFGYSVSYSDETVRLTQANAVQSDTSTSPSSPASSPPPSSVAAPIPSKKLDIQGPIDLKFLDNSVPLTGKVYYEGDHLMVWLPAVFSKLGYAESIQGTSFSYKKENSSYTFSSESSEIITTKSGKETTFSLSCPLMLKENQPYVSLDSLLLSMGYSYELDPDHGIIYALIPLESIQYGTFRNSPTIRLNASLPLSISKPQSLTFRRGYYLTIPFADGRHLDSITVQDPFIKRIVVSHRNFGTALKIYTKQPLRYPHLITKDGVQEIQFDTQLSDITFQGTALILSATDTLDAEATVFQNPSRYVIDLPDTLNGVPSELPLSSPFVSKIRTSQYKTDPPVTRVVLDLKEGYDALLTQKSSRQLVVTFPPSKGGKSPDVATQTAAPKKSRSFISSLSPDVSLSDSLSGKVIVLDAGHGGRDPGAVVQKSIQEKYFTLDITQRLAKRLRKQGALVILTRTKDRDILLSHRAIIANKNKADAFVSIHINSFIKPHASGTETYYYKSKDRALAYYLQKSMMGSLQLQDNGVKRARLYVLRHTKMPAALVEPLFLAHSSELDLIQSSSYREKIAEALEKGLSAYFSSDAYKASSKK